MIRVLVVEDSPTARRYLVSLLEDAGGFEVVGQAVTGEEAVRLFAATAPDLVSLDVFLPDASAAQVAERMLALRYVPIVLLSDAPRASDEVFQALSAGALDVVRKPRPKDRQAVTLALTSLRALSRVMARRAPPRPGEGPLALLAIAASTGGPGALKTLLSGLPRGFPLPVVIAQHLSRGFAEGMARWLSQTSGVPVAMAQGGDRLRPGEALLGPPEHDLSLRTRDEVAVRKAGPAGYHPSADVLFSSATAVLGGGVVAVVLSGVGSDGLEGARAVVKAGGLVLAQDRATSAVFGMPGAVVKAGLASMEDTPEALARAVLATLARRGVAGALTAPAQAWPR